MPASEATMKLIAILATLAVASASAQQECSGPANIPTDDPVAAQTAMCLLSIDNRLLVNERCNVLFLPDGREVALDAGNTTRGFSSDARPPRYTHSCASWNRGSGRSDPLTRRQYQTDGHRNFAGIGEPNARIFIPSSSSMSTAPPSCASVSADHCSRNASTISTCPAAR